ncbi:YdcF family protein [Magnetococcus sp. PR-3]|uniref:YdcF family protein n=1 Tax=Magnetococcus sp. PR-3 TaxID=3120355 RepID=UPI002FCE3D2C
MIWRDDWKQAAHWLITNDQPVMADAIVVLGGGIPTRPKKGFALLDQGWAPQLIFVGDNRLTLQQIGRYYCNICDFKRPDVHILGATLSTHEDLRTVRTHLKPGAYNKILLVTDPYHTRRARILATRLFAAQDMQVHVISSQGYFKLKRPDTPWWKDTLTLRTVVSEWIKLLIYTPLIWIIGW